MELADVAFYTENTSKHSILGRRWRKCNMKEKLDNVHDENRGKLVMLWKFLNDRQIHKEYNPVQTGPNDTYNSTGEYQSVSYESYSLNGYESRTTLNQAHLFDDEYSSDSLSNSDSSSALSDWLRPGLIREAGDGTETPESPRFVSNREARKRPRRMIASTSEQFDIDASKVYSKRELEYSCTLLLFAGPVEPSTSSARERGATPSVITKSTCIHPNHKCESRTEVNNKDCLNMETSRNKRCYAFTLTKTRRRHNAKNKLKQLMKLYKARKLNKKRSSKEHVKSIENVNGRNTGRCYSAKLTSSSGPFQNSIHDDIYQTANGVWCCAPYRDTVHRVCESTEKNDIFCNRLADFYDCECLDFAMDCYCSETDEFAYQKNGFVMD